MTSKSAWAAMILRVIVGITFLVHGVSKFMMGFDGIAQFFSGAGIPLPFASAVLVTLAESIGGLLLILGLLTKWAAIPLLITMLVALFAVHLKGGFFLPNGFEFVLVLIAALVSIMISGPGAFSLGDKIWGRDF